MYDCCDGDNQLSRDASQPSPDIRKGNDKMNDNDTEIEEKTQLRKVTDAYGTDKEIWIKGDPNPDYKLVIINSSNTGFISQMGSKSGSFMIKKFTEKLSNKVGIDDNKLFLNEIFHEIQDELHGNDIQLIEAKYNNRLEYVKFERNNDTRPGNTELMQIMSDSEFME